MTLRIASLLLLAVALGLTGCRDTLVDEPLPSDNQPPSPADSSAQRQMYLKGPDELRVGASGNYRAELMFGAVRYRWTLAGGTGGVTGEATDPLFRLYAITGVSEGSVQLYVSAYDEDNEVIGLASKTVAVIR